MKKIILWTVIAFTGSGNLFSQTIFLSYGTELMNKIKNGPLYIIPSGDKVFDDSLKTAVEKHWKFCTSKVVELSEVDSYVKDENKIFIAALKVLPENMGGIKKPTAENTVLFIFAGHKASKKNIIDLRNQIIRVQPVFWDKKLTANRLGFPIKRMNDLINCIHSKQITSRAPMFYDKIITDGTPQNHSSLKEKILLVDVLATKYYLPEKVLQEYKYKYQVADAEEIIKLMNVNPKKYCFLSDIVISTSSIEIYDAETCSLLYGIPGKMTGGKINDKQIQALNLAIDK